MMVVTDMMLVTVVEMKFNIKMKVIMVMMMVVMDMMLVTAVEMMLDIMMMMIMVMIMVVMDIMLVMAAKVVMSEGDDDVGTVLLLDIENGTIGGIYMMNIGKATKLLI